MKFVTYTLRLEVPDVDEEEERDICHIMDEAKESLGQLVRNRGFKSWDLSRGVDVEDRT